MKYGTDWYPRVISGLTMNTSILQCVELVSSRGNLLGGEFPEVKRQLFLTRKLSAGGDFTRELAPGLWPHLLEKVNREKPVLMPKLIQDLLRVWQWEKKTSRKRALPGTDDTVAPC